MSELLLRDLTVERGGRAVVRDVSVEIPAGQVTALLGPNGAGKSTLVLAVGGVLRPKAGAVLLDEPAAGLPEEETAHLTSVIKSIPERTGALVILVDHDMSLVSAVCETTAVLDFGKLIASGPTAAVLRDENVMRAYIGTAEVAT
ncbi:MAG: ATP-binding cassette domain-containing protein [Trebonia sp.]